jgi:hypothetical protein
MGFYIKNKRVYMANRVIGIHISGVDIHFVGLTLEEDMILAYYLKSIKVNDENEIVEAINNTYHQDKEFFKDAIININIPRPDLLRVVKYEKDIIDEKEIIEWETSNYLEDPSSYYCNSAFLSYYLVIGCTTNPGDCEKFRLELEYFGVNVVYNPEFIAQGSIVKDLQNADMVLIVTDVFEFKV